MSKVLAVAVLDIRRLGFGVFSAALVAGLVPAFASGMGEPLQVRDLLLIAFAVVGLISGGYFGADFAEGRSSFYFARPLPTAALIAGRFLSLIILTVTTFLAVMASNWLSTSDRTGWELWVISQKHVEAVGLSWSFGVFMSLAAAVHGKTERGMRSWRELFLIPIRLGLSLGGILLVFGLFADLTVRAYEVGDPGPIRLFFGSWFAGALVASCVGIFAGRTERLRIAWFQNAVMAVQLGITAVVVLVAWIYVLHPSPEAINSVHSVVSAPDGRSAYVRAIVDRGDPKSFFPLYSLDPSTGQVRHMNADPVGPWTSADGGTVVWSEATPYFFRPLWRLFGGPSSFRVRTGGNTETLPLPKRFTESFTRGTNYFMNRVDHVVPSNRGDVFAVIGMGHLTFVTRSGGESPDVDLGSAVLGLGGTPTFMPTGQLRIPVMRYDGGTRIEFMDIDPRSRKVTIIASINTGRNAEVRFNRSATLALVKLPGAQVQRSSASLVRLDGVVATDKPITLVPESFGLQSLFLEDGRIVVLAGSLRERALKIYSSTGALLLDQPTQGTATSLHGEMFPGMVAILQTSMSPAGILQELLLVDCGTGSVNRRLQGMSSSTWLSTSWGASIAPPETVGAHLIESKDQKLYELASPTADPRLLLPLPRQ